MVEESKDVKVASVPTISIEQSESSVDVGPFGFPLPDPFADSQEEGTLVQFSQVQ